jgi:hypothetical protein
MPGTEPSVGEEGTRALMSSLDGDTGGTISGPGSLQMRASGRTAVEILRRMSSLI